MILSYALSSVIGLLVFMHAMRIIIYLDTNNLLIRETKEESQ